MSLCTSAGTTTGDDVGSGDFSYEENEADDAAEGDRGLESPDSRGSGSEDDLLGGRDLLRGLESLLGEDAGTAWTPVQDPPRLLRPPHCRGEAVVCVVPLLTPSTFCYTIITRLGRAGVYDAGLNLLDSYSLELGFTPPKAKIGIGREGDAREPRQRTTWINDAVFLPDAQALVVAASDRSLTVLDASRPLHSRRCEVRSLPAAPCCLAYAAGCSESGSKLFIGDDAGGITTLTFKRPRQALFRPPDAENKSTSFFWQEVLQQTDWVSVQTEPRVHADAVSRVEYCAHNDTLVSCSRDPVTTLTIRHLAGRRAPYVFRMPRGASCFVLQRGEGGPVQQVQQLLVTGGRDGVVRLWNPLVPAQPLSTLEGHKAPVLDVLVLARGALVASLDLRGELRLWDAQCAGQSCLQALSLPFSCLGVPGRRVEHGGKALHLGPPSTSGRSPGFEVVMAALCGELVLVRVTFPPSAGDASPSEAGVVADLVPPRRDHSPAVPRSWAPSLLDASSRTTSKFTPSSKDDKSDSFGGSSASQHTPEKFPSPYKEQLELLHSHDSAEDCLQGISLPLDKLPLPNSPFPLPECVSDWPLQEDNCQDTQDDTLSHGALPSPKALANQGQPVSHRPTPDENGLYPEEIASLRALGLQPLDLESLGVGLQTPTAAGNDLSLVPLNALDALRHAQAQQKRSYKQMRTLVWHCAPHLALRLPEDTPLQFSKQLPVTSRMKARGLDTLDPSMILKAKFPRPIQAGRPKSTYHHISGSATSSIRLSSVGESGSVGGDAS